MIEEIIHVLPLGDVEEHSEEIVDHLGLPVPMCKCNPNVLSEYMSDVITVVHNSFDGREGVEWANVILSNDSNGLAE